MTGQTEAAAPELPRLVRDPLLPVYAYLLLTVALPSHMVIGPLRSYGSPMRLAALAALLAWALAAVVPGRLPRGFNPVKAVLAGYAAALLLAFGAAHLRALSGVEVAASLRTATSLASAMGLALLTADGLRSKAHVLRLVRVFTLSATVMAMLGLAQFFTGVPPKDYIVVPGMTLQDYDVITERATFERVQGTAAHPIEFSILLATALPLALYLATRRRRGSAWWFLAVLVIALAVPTSVSRSGVIAVAVALVVLAVVWPWRQRVNLVLGSAAVLLVMHLSNPLLLETLGDLFVSADRDPSISSRTEDYPKVAALVAQTPWLGRGLGTFEPSRYFYLDNQYLGTLLEGGVIGLVALVALFLVALGTARGIRHHSPDPDSRMLGQACVAAICVSVVTWATYDGLGFRANTGFLFTLIGLVGGLWRLEVRRPRWGVFDRPAVPARPRAPGTVRVPELR